MPTSGLAENRLVFDFFVVSQHETKVTQGCFFNLSVTLMLKIPGHCRALSGILQTGRIFFYGKTGTSD